MNERIKELWVQGTQTVVPREGDYSSVSARNIEKFAELIVDECLQVCEKIRQDALVQKKSEFLTVDGKMLYEGVYGGATNCGFAIQSMFKDE